MESNKIGNLSFINDDYLFIITQAELLVRDWLQKFSRSSDFLSQMKEIFGEVELRSLQQQWKRREFEFPEIEIVGKKEIGEANGAFTQADSRIYIAREFLAENIDNISLIVSVLLEEFGHFIDKKLHLNLDTNGDEGELFAAIVTGKELTDTEIQLIKQEDDSAIVTINGQTLELEQANYNLSLIEVYDDQSQVIIENDDTPVAPSDLIITLNLTNYHPSQPLILQGSVSDNNGSENLALIDLWLYRPNQTWTSLSDIFNIVP
ncbi:hypothetical protein [Crocosphaera sp.]|uniref:hypothetical protein n=1 Tax=Crocosphaera sp. TaxID=2729996 RepID=UPI003F254868|nr:hypothetical protein [Crocosphaera sp.]